LRFANPLFFLLAILVIGVIVWRRKIPLHTALHFSNVASLKELEDKKTRMLAKWGIFVRYFILFLIVIALARPQGVDYKKEVKTEGIDIMLVMDVSGSMKAEDFKPDNRLTVAKKTVRTFIDKRKTDRIGLVVFGGEAFTQCPLTHDYTILDRFLEKIKIDMAGDGTAIGMAMVTALNRMKDSESKSKIMILLTDGVNNTGEISPLNAAEIAKDLGVKIYTIGVGKEGGAPIPIDDPKFGRVYARYPDGRLVLTELDSETLQRISAVTLGQYFRATDETELEKIYAQIDLLEKTSVKTTQFQKITEFFPLFVWLIFLSLCFEILIANVFMVKIP
jgi:Ca-activated chloride channel family protein